MELTIELTYECPLNCIHCSSIGYSSVLTLDNIKGVLRKYKIKEIILSGGEPVTHPHFQKIVKYLTRMYKVSLYTSGILSIPNDLILKFHKIYVSLYGWEKFHNSITKSNFFGESLIFLINAGIQMRFFEQRAKDVLINSPIFGGKVKEIIHIAQIRNFPIHLIRLLPHGRAKNIKVLSREKQLKIAEKIKKEYPETIISQSLLHDKCNWKSKLTLLPNKKLIGCVAGKHYPELKQKYICDVI